MHRNQILLISLFFLLSPIWAASGPAGQGTGTVRLVPVQLPEADKAYEQRLIPAQAKRALELYRELIALDPSAAEYHWKAARAAWWLGDRAERRKQKLEYFRLGTDLAEKAIALDPDSAPSHYWLAGNYGSLGETKGILKSLSLVKPIRRQLNEVLRIDESYDGGGAHRILGAMDYKVPGIAGGDKRRALMRLTKALEFDPDHASTLYYLAEYYHVIGEPEKSKEFLDQLQDLEAAGHKKADIIHMQQKGKALLKKITR